MRGGGPVFSSLEEEDAGYSCYQLQLSSWDRKTFF